MQLIQLNNQHHRCDAKGGNGTQSIVLLGANEVIYEEEEEETCHDRCFDEDEEGGDSDKENTKPNFIKAKRCLLDSSSTGSSGLSASKSSGDNGWIQDIFAIDTWVKILKCTKWLVRLSILNILYCQRRVSCLPLAYCIG